MQNLDAMALYKYIELQALQCDADAIKLVVYIFYTFFHSRERRQLQRDPRRVGLGWWSVRL